MRVEGASCREVVSWLILAKRGVNCDVRTTSVLRRYCVGAPVLCVCPALTNSLRVNVALRVGALGLRGFDSCEVRHGKTGSTDAVKQVQTVTAQNWAFCVNLNSLEKGVDGRA